MDDKEFYVALQEMKLEKTGEHEPLHETVAVLSYETGRILEQSTYMLWEGRTAVRMGYLKSELMDVVAQVCLLCVRTGTSWEEMRELGIEKAMERFTGKEKK